MSFESHVEQPPQPPHDQVGALLEKLSAEDEMNPQPIEITVDNISDVIDHTGLSPDALEQYRV